ncbi:MAG: orotate phosphoribosyltransferase [Gammaproteobacteria bacterium]
MPDYRQDFVRFCLDCDVLRFGRFTLKSGRESPYFFNSGLFNTGARLDRLGRFYAAAVQASGIGFDMLYGPAYKGIPLACALACALAREHGRDLPWAFNRKEAKDHGEGGTVVGAPLAGRVLIVDDVVSAGTSVRESIEVIRGAGAEPAAVAIALDRQERGQGALSAVQEIVAGTGLPVVSVITLADLVAFLEGSGGREADLARIHAYRDQWGVQG